MELPGFHSKGISSSPQEINCQQEEIMEKKKQRPSVLITTYSGNSISGSQQQVASATKSEKSTDLFSNSRKSHSKFRIFYDLNQIKGPSGSIRGHKDVVKKSLENIKVVASSSQRNFASSNLPTFMTTNASNNSTIQQIDELYRSEYLDKLIEEEQNQCVAYTTTLGVIRRTFEDSKLMRSILNLNLIRYEERDIYLNQEYKYQLRMRCKSIMVPALFVDGQHIGGIKELELMNEDGKLSLLLSQFKMSKASKNICLCCGNAKFIACQSCNGSRKSTIHHFKFNSIALRCIKCDNNDGLIQCPVCSCQPGYNNNNSNNDDKNNNDNDINNNNNIFHLITKK